MSSKDLWSDLKDVPIQQRTASKLRRTRRSIIGNGVAVGLIAMLSLALYRGGAFDRMRADNPPRSAGSAQRHACGWNARGPQHRHRHCRALHGKASAASNCCAGRRSFDVVHDTARPFVSLRMTRWRARGHQHAVQRADGEQWRAWRCSGRREASCEVAGRGERVVLNAQAMLPV